MDDGTNMNHGISRRNISATIKADGAELCSLKNAQGQELLWQAGEVWPRHAPVLFPIVGRLKDDRLKHQGKFYPMTQHGFARDRTFEWGERSSTRCALVLHDDAATRAQFPFAFRLRVSYAVTESDLEVEFEITNTGDETLPASIGAHPAFNWPLSAGIAKDGYSLKFSDEEHAPIRRLEGGLMRARSEPTPVRGNILPLSEGLFADDAVILDRPASTAVRYAADRGPAIEVSWQGFKELGIWSKPGGAPFLCIEPWAGYASPLDFDGEFMEKPGVMHIAPGATCAMKIRIRVS
jgi:galactose mutarotase-like enzyme